MRPDEKRHVGPRLHEAATEIAADGPGAETENPHASSSPPVAIEKAFTAVKQECHPASAGREGAS
jgi:hypothetical protein